MTHKSKPKPCHHIGPSIIFKKAFPSSLILALSVQQTNLQWMIFIEEWPSSMTLLSWMLFDTISKAGCHLGAGPNHSNWEKPLNVKASNFLGRENICLILHQFFSWRPSSSFWPDLFSYSCILKKVHILGHSEDWVRYCFHHFGGPVHGEVFLVLLVTGRIPHLPRLHSTTCHIVNLTQCHPKCP